MYKSDGIEVQDAEDLTKKDIRRKVWEYLHKTKLARFPLPVYNRIPNYLGSSETGPKVTSLPVFQSAQTIKINPDKPQEEIRFLTLQERKRLLVPTPRLRTGLFNVLEHEEVDDQTTLRVKAQSEGIKKSSKTIDLDDKVKIDLIVLGSVAVSKTGRRIGKGEGFADMEYAMMKTMGAITDDVKIVTTVHDCQVFDDLPERIFSEHDVPVDIIVTPTQVIELTHSLPKPQRIYWHLLSVNKFLQIPILKVLYQREQEKGVDVTLEDEGLVPPTQEEIDKYQEAPRGRGGRNRRAVGGRYGRGGDRSFAREGEVPEGGEGIPSPRGRRGMRRGRGMRGARRSFNQRQPNGNSEGEDGNNDDVNIHVTINVNKQNKIVRRKVESTDQKDRVGSAELNGEERKPRRQNTPPTFSIFIGGIPRFCRPYNLRNELAKRGVHPMYITWKGSSGFAFLNFGLDKSEEENILSQLQDFTIRNRTMTVDKAKGKVFHQPEDKEDEEGAVEEAEVPEQQYPDQEDVNVPDVSSLTLENNVEELESAQ